MKARDLDRSIREVHRWHRKAMEQKLNRTGIHRAQHQILMYLSDHPQSSQKQIAEDFQISQPAVGVSLKKLEQGGYIQRVVDSEDNRYHQVTLTEQGRQIVCESHKIFGEVTEAMYQGLSQEDKEYYYGVNQRIQENLQRLCEEEGEGE